MNHMRIVILFVSYMIISATICVVIFANLSHDPYPLYADIVSSSCKYVVRFRVDSRFDNGEKFDIIMAARAWFEASDYKVCFKIRSENLNIEESTKYLIDGSYTVYSGKPIWQQIAGGLLHKCNIFSACLAVTVRGLDGRADIFAMKRIRFKETMIHEIGHVLGIGHSKDKKDIMYKSITGVNKISVSDRAVLKCLVDSDTIFGWLTNCKY